MKTKKAQTDKFETLKKTSLIVGIITFVLMLIAWLPCLNWINYINMWIAILGGILSAVALGLGWKTGPKKKPIIGLILCICAYWFAIPRIILSIFLGAGLL